jgi:hypothetical protein
MTSPGILQDRRWMNSAPSPFRLNGVSSLAATIARAPGFRQQMTVLAGRAMYASFLKIRATSRVFRGQGARQAPIFLQESEDGIRRRLGGRRRGYFDIWPPGLTYGRRAEQLAFT